MPVAHVITIHSRKFFMKYEKKAVNQLVTFLFFHEKFPKIVYQHMHFRHTLVKPFLEYKNNLFN